MDLLQEVLAFSREYVNGINQNKDRKQKIAAAYKQLTRENLRVGCGTCYIEAIFTIKKIMEKKPCSYQLKPGAVLIAFSDASKTCTNKNITDELAEYHLRTNPGCIKWFSVPSEAVIKDIIRPVPKKELIIVPADVPFEVAKAEATEVIAPKPVFKEPVFKGKRGRK